MDRSAYANVTDAGAVLNTFLGVLQALFFFGLDCEDGRPEKTRYAPVLGDVPYLNGGLFAKDVLDEPGIGVPDGAFGLLFDERDGRSGSSTSPSRKARRSTRRWRWTRRCSARSSSGW